MRAIVTGSHGFVAPYLIKELQKRNIEVVIFNRSKMDILSFEQVRRFIKDSDVDLFFHVAVGDLKWIENIVEACRILNVKLIYTSSVSVFSEKGSGPYYVDSIPNAQEPYGIYKYQGERIVSEYLNSLIARIGWQIGYEINSNNMFDFLFKQYEQNHKIVASKLWYPSCSFVDDTCKCIVDLALTSFGLFQLNSNESYSFYDIANHIKEKMNMNWLIEPSYDFKRDDRMFDDRVNIKKLSINR